MAPLEVAAVYRLPRLTRTLRACRDRLSRAGFCTRPFGVALAWTGREDGPKPSNGLSNFGVVYARSLEEAARLRARMIVRHKGDTYVLVWAGDHVSDEFAFFTMDGELIPTERAWPLLDATRVPPSSAIT